jgi:hypothetical protein
MPTPTYTPIATQTLVTGTTTVTFSAIPSDYTDLILQTQARVASGALGLTLQFNSDTTTNYSNVFLYGTGSIDGSVRNGTTNQVNLGYAAILDSTNWWMSTSHIMSYSNTTTFKTVVSRDGDATEGVDAIVSLWRKTPEAINRIDIKNTGSSINFAIGSTFTLYGIKAGS